MKKFEHKTTEFQRRLPNNRETILHIFETLFPDIDVDWNVERGAIKCSPHPYYTWVMFRWRGITFSIDNHKSKINRICVYGYRSHEDYAKISFSFEVIIFGSNKIEVSDMRKKRVNKILRNAGYKKPSLQEWFNEYNTD